MIATEKTWLVIPYAQLPTAKKTAGLLPDGKTALAFDKNLKLWFAKPGADLLALKPWLPDPMAQPIMEKDPRVEFAQVLTDAGFELDGLPEMDGQRHRVRTIEDKPGQKTGVYVGYLDGIPAVWYQDHRLHNDPIRWKSTPSQVDKTAQHHLRAQSEQRKQTREKEQARQYQHHALRVRQLWALLPEAEASHPYLQKKGMTLTKGVKQDKKGRLVIPLRDAEGHIKSLQRISKNGFKSLKKGAQKNGNFFVVGGSLKKGQPLLYAEGYATAASISEATGLPVVMAVDAGNMPKVASALARLYPESPSLFLADDDRKKTTNKGVQKAQEAAALTKGTVICPIFSEEEKQQNLTDFNDLHQSQGLAAVKSQLLPYVETLLKNKASDPIPTPSPSSFENNETPSSLIPESDGKIKKTDRIKATARDETGHNRIDIEPIRHEKRGKKPQMTPVDPDALLHQITHRFEGNTVVYFHEGERAFIDHGHQITMASPQASQNRTMVLAALLVAKHHYQGKITLTGSEAFKKRAITLIAEHRLELMLKHPHQQHQLDQALQRLHQKHPYKEKPKEEAKGATKNHKVKPIKKSVATEKPTSSPQSQWTGKLLEHGGAPYQFNPEKGRSYFLRMRTREGEKVIWGKELAQALNDSGMKKGDMIHLHCLGQQPLTLNIPIRDEQGQIVRWEKKEGHRHQWKITSAIDARLLVADEKNAFSPSELLAYDRVAFDKIQRAVFRQTGITLPLPSGESGLLWLQPDGKGTSKTGNAETVSLPLPQTDTGLPFMSAPSAEGKMILYLVKGQGEYVQGIVHHQGEYRHALGLFGQKENDRPYLMLNAVDKDGLHSMGYGHALHKLRGAPMKDDRFVFRLDGEKAPIFAQLHEPEKMTAEQYQKSGFQARSTVSHSYQPDTIIRSPKTAPVPESPSPCPGI